EVGVECCLCPLVGAEHRESPGADVEGDLDVLPGEQVVRVGQYPLLHQVGQSRCRLGGAGPALGFLGVVGGGDRLYESVEGFVFACHGDDVGTAGGAATEDSVGGVGKHLSGFQEVFGVLVEQPF